MNAEVTNHRILVGLLLFSFAPLVASQPQPAEILSRVSAVYTHFQAIHIVATEDSGTDYEIARRGNQFRAAIRSADNEGLAVCNGKVLYKALPRAREWTRTWASVASVDMDDGSDAPPLDLYGVLARRLITRYAALPTDLENPQIVREDSVMLSTGSAPAWVLRAGTRELWIERNRFLVLRDSGIRVTRIETAAEVAPSLFTFSSDRKWKEVKWAPLLFLPEETPLSLPGLPAADFELHNLSGESKRLSDFRGQVVLLDFWATWCQPCRKELPAVDKLRAEFGGQVQFLTIDDEDGDKLRDFLRKNGFAFEVLRDPTHRVHGLFGARTIPATILVDRKGVVRERLIGSHSEGAIRKAIQSTLKAD